MNFLMKHLILPILLALSFTAFAQQSTIVSVTPSKDDMSAFERKLYLYPEFVNGKLVYNDSAIGEAKMNFNRFFGQVHFISAKGDTLTIKDPSSVAYFILG